MSHNLGVTVHTLSFNTNIKYKRQNNIIKLAWELLMQMLAMQIIMYISQGLNSLLIREQKKCNKEMFLLIIIAFEMTRQCFATKWNCTLIKSNYNNYSKYSLRRNFKDYAKYDPFIYLFLKALRLNTRKLSNLTFILCVFKSKSFAI